ncbi:MAG: Xaa-Pro peptidase family protein [Actinomycetota bacterium]
MDHAGRRTRVAARLAEIGVPTILVTDRANVRYLTGFTGSAGVLLLSGDRPALLLTDGRYTEQARREGSGVEVLTPATGLLRAAAERAVDAGASRIGFETSLPYASFGDLAERLDGVELIGVSGLVEGERLTKDADEVRTLERAQACTDAAFDAVIGGLRPGVTERQVALELEIAMRRAGADDRAFEPIVAFGERAAEPHHAPTDRALTTGDVVKMDFGALVDGYHADMTRTAALGDPGPELRRIHATVLGAHEAGVAALTPGVQVREVEAAARAVVEEAGYGHAWVHPLGHGVGLQIHEAPILRRDERTMIPDGAVVTIEPGIYVPGLGGVRIEDMVEVTEDGPRPLPDASKDLLVL